MKLKLIIGGIIAIPTILIVYTAFSVQKSYEDKCCKFAIDTRNRGKY